MNWLFGGWIAVGYVYLCVRVGAALGRQFVRDPDDSAAEKAVRTPKWHAFVDEIRVYNCRMSGAEDWTIHSNRFYS